MYFLFTDHFGDHKITAQDAQELLQVSRRTIQNYYHANRRDPAKWAYLEAHTTGRIIPAEWDLRHRDNYLHSSTGYSFERQDLEQIAFVHSLKDNTIAGLKDQIADLTDKLAQISTPDSPETIISPILPANVYRLRG